MTHIINCNRCNAPREGHIHPCPNCLCFEYSLTGELAEIENNAGSSKEQKWKRTSGNSASNLPSCAAPLAGMINSERRPSPELGVTARRDGLLFDL